MLFEALITEDLGILNLDSADICMQLFFFWEKTLGPLGAFSGNTMKLELPTMRCVSSGSPGHKGVHAHYQSITKKNISIYYKA